MKKWYSEEWCFVIEVLRVGKANRAEECRLGLEPGDAFECAYETPAGFCPTAFIKLFPALEAVRCQGDLRLLGGAGAQETLSLCPDGVVLFRIKGERIDGAATDHEENVE
jgi:uncharacterized repeat protein (TIGR04076 family)